MSADIKTLLRSRFAPIPAATTDPGLAGQLYVRRLKVPELQEYLKAVATPGREDKPMFLLSLAVCDADGGKVFDTPEEAEELLGDQYLPLYEQVAALLFPGGTEKNSARGESPPNG